MGNKQRAWFPLGCFKKNGPLQHSSAHCPPVHWQALHHGAELKEFSTDKTNKNNNPKAAQFAKVLMEEIEERMPEYGTTNLVDAMSDYYSVL